MSHTPVFTPQPGWGDDPTPPRPNRRWLVAVIAAALAFAVIGSVALVVWRPWEAGAGPTTSGGPGPSTDGTTTQTGQTPAETVAPAPLVRGLAFPGAECVKNPQDPPVYVCLGREPPINVHWTGTPTIPDRVVMSVTFGSDTTNLNQALTSLDAVWGRDAGDQLRAAVNLADGQTVNVPNQWGTIVATRYGSGGTGALGIEAWANGTQRLQVNPEESELSPAAAQAAAESLGWSCTDIADGVSCTGGGVTMRALDAGNPYWSFDGENCLQAADEILSQFPTQGPPLLAALRGIPEDRSITVHDGWTLNRYPDFIAVAQDRWR